MSAPVLQAGDRIVVTAGLSKGLAGTVVAPWHPYAKDIPAYRVNLGGLLRDRIIRADFLEKREVST